MSTDIVALMVLGYERDRHITGLTLLATSKSGQKLRRIYIAMSREEPYKSIAKKNADYIVNLVEKLFPGTEIERLEFDAYRLQDIAALFSCIVEKEQGKAEIWIDLTSTTKEVISLSTFFTLFGVRIYWVASPAASGQTRLEERIRQSFLQMKDGYLASLNNLSSRLCKMKKTQEKDRLMAKFFNETIEKYLDVVREQYETRKATKLVEMPIRTVEKTRTLLRPIKLRDIHRKILIDLKGNELTLSELENRNKGVHTQMALRYALMNLFSIGFIEVKERKYKLTEIGEGYAIGIGEARCT